LNVRRMRILLHTPAVNLPGHPGLHGLTVGV
jgi:hypothetical protein